ncbi:MAG: acyl carrier protein [Gemmatimonadetes bacterium]|nr:acyl carrier protein [Gemmatimonadota bacterium]
MFNLESVSRETSAETVERWDSMSHLDLIASLEEVFEVEFDDVRVGELTTVGVIVDEIESLKSDAK